MISQLRKYKFLFQKSLHFFLLPVFLIVSILVYTNPHSLNADVTYNFAYKIGGGSGASVQKMTRDSSGNIYIVGYYQGANIDFDPGAGTANLSSVSTSVDIFVAKFDSNGSYIWAKSMGGTSADYAMSVIVDSTGNVYTTGYFAGSNVDFDPGAGTALLSSSGSNDIFISKLDSSGSYIWAKKIGGTLGDIGYDIALDSSNAVYTTGYFAGSNVDFDPGAGTANLTSDGGNDIFVSKLNNDGTYAWAKKMGGTGADVGYSLTLDSSNNVYTTGTYNVSSYFPSGSGFGCSAQGGTDVFISKLDSNGNYSNRICAVRGASNEFSQDIFLDSSNNIYLAGYFAGTPDFDPGAGTVNLASANLDDVFISKLTNAGAYIWAKRLGGTGNDRATNIFVNDNNVYTTGLYSNIDADFDPGASTVTWPTFGGGTDIFISQLDLSGNFALVKGIGGTLSEEARGLVGLSNSETVYIGGYFNGTVDFDPGAGTANLTSGGAINVFFGKYDGVSPASVNITPSADVMIDEGSTNTSAYSVVLGSAPSANVTITISETSPAVTLNTSSLTFTTSNWNTPQSVSVTGATDSDLVDANDQVLTFDISSSDSGYNALPDQTRQVDINDTSTASFSINPSTDFSITEGENNLIAYTVVLGAQPATDVVINISENPASSAITLNTTSLTFTNANWNVEQQVLLSAPEESNSTNEQNQPLLFSINDTSSDNNFDPLVDQTRNIDVTDNDVPGFTLTQSGGSSSVIEEGATDSFTIVLNSQPTGNVVIDTVSTDTTSVTLSVPEVTFSTVDWNLPQTVTLTGINDADSDNETVALNITIDQTNTLDTNYDPLPAQNFNVSVTDNDAPDLVIFENKFPPINGGSVTQRKSGSLKVGGVTSTAYARFDGLLQILGNQGPGKVLTSDADGDATWATPSGGSSSAGGWTLSGNTVSLTTTSDPISIGANSVIYKQGNRFIHSNGTGNFFAGINSGSLNPTGAGNTAVGKEALLGLVNTSNGEYNTALGYQALSKGDGWLTGNTAIGSKALGGNVNNSLGGGVYNTAIGYEALLNTYATAGTGVGAANTAVGYQALKNNTTGSFNVAVGSGALINNTTGHYNIAIGFGAGTTTGNLHNTVAIGYGTTVDQSNKIRLGNTNIEHVIFQVAPTVISDLRLKENINDIDLGLEFIKKLRPVSYTLKGGKGIDYGFIAQEVETAIGKDTNLVLTDNTEFRGKTMRYEGLIAPLVKAVLEQDAQLQNDKKDLEDFEKRLVELENKLK